MAGIHEQTVRLIFRRTHSTIFRRSAEVICGETLERTLRGILVGILERILGVSREEISRGSLAGFLREIPRIFQKNTRNRIAVTIFELICEQSPEGFSIAHGVIFGELLEFCEKLWKKILKEFPEKFLKKLLNKYLNYFSE